MRMRGALRLRSGRWSPARALRRTRPRTSRRCHRSRATRASRATCAIRRAENLFQKDRHARMRPWTRRWIATCRLCRATGTALTLPRPPAWSMNAPTAPPILKEVLNRLRSNLEAAERQRPERGDQGDVDRIAAPTDDHASHPGRVVARVERVPAPVQVDLEPGG